MQLYPVKISLCVHTQSVVDFSHEKASDHNKDRTKLVIVWVPWRNYKGVKRGRHHHKMKESLFTSKAMTALLKEKDGLSEDGAIFL